MSRVPPLEALNALLSGFPDAKTAFCARPSRRSAPCSGSFCEISPQLSQRFRDPPAAQLVPSRSDPADIEDHCGRRLSPDFRNAAGRLPQAPIRAGVSVLTAWARPAEGSKGQCALDRLRPAGPSLWSHLQGRTYENLPVLGPLPGKRKEKPAPESGPPAQGRSQAVASSSLLDGTSWPASRTTAAADFPGLPERGLDVCLRP